MWTWRKISTCPTKHQEALTEDLPEVTLALEDQVMEEDFKDVGRGARNIPVSQVNG